MQSRPYVTSISNASFTSLGVSSAQYPQGPQAPFFSITLVLLGKIEGIKFGQPLTVTIERDEDGTYITSDLIFCMHGTGNSLEESVLDYIGSLREYYGHLEDDENRETASLFKYLQSYIAILP